uniref:Nucleolar complex protein 2 homolog n=1 Tax=Kalanchoe fedtschenkoi TaxID=63787 RepID=A0A7N0V3M6_KALFE
MGKLGKNARKFAKKNLQSVHKRQRKVKALVKKRFSSKRGTDVAEDEVDTKMPIKRTYEDEGHEETSLHAIFNDEDSDLTEDASSSDGYLSEDSSCADIAQIGSHETSPDGTDEGELAVQNKAMKLELAKQKNKLDRLIKKDPAFSKFLESYANDQASNDDMFSDEDEVSNDDMQPANGDSSGVSLLKTLTKPVIDSWCELVLQHDSLPALVILINGYRAACHHGAESDTLGGASSNRFQNSEAFGNLTMFMLREADGIFRKLLGISTSSFKKEAVLDLKNTSKWKDLKPLVKSYIRSTLFILNQFTDAETLAFTLSRLRASLILLAPFPSLLRRLLKIAVQLWATMGAPISLCAFHIIHDVASIFDAEYFDLCLIKTYKAYVSRNEVLDPASLNHIKFLKDSVLELCSLDLQKSSSKAQLSIQQLAKILKQGLCAKKKKEAVEKICTWEYIFCLELWVEFISANVLDFDLQALLHSMIQIINGVAYLFPGPRYIPLRLKCVRWLNDLSSASRIFIPVASFALDALEYESGKPGTKLQNGFDVSAAIKLPKQWLKSRSFQQECVSSAIELLCAHFAQWSYHISFPELATIPLIRLRKFYDSTTDEGFRRMVKRFMDQVEQNVDYLQKRRDEVAYSPKDFQSADTFLQLEKSSGNTPFSQYYKSTIANAAAKKLVARQKKSAEVGSRTKKRKEEAKKEPQEALVDIIGEKASQSSEGNNGKKRRNNGKKRRIS